MMPPMSNMMPSSSFFLRKFYFLAKILKSEEVSHGDHVLGLRPAEDDALVLEPIEDDREPVRTGVDAEDSVLRS